MKNRLVIALVACFVVGLGPTAPALASTGQSAEINAVQDVSEAPTADGLEVDALATDLQILFEEVMIVDDYGVVSFNEARAAELLGPEAATDLSSQLTMSSGAGLATVGGPKLLASTASTGQSFVDCMVQNSVLGLVGGLVGGAYTELIRQQKWDELAEALLPRLVRAGFAGGVAGVVVSLATGAVQCSFFRS